MNGAEEVHVVLRLEDLQKCHVRLATNNRDRGTQFMRGIGYKAPLTDEGLFKMVDHLVEGQRKIAYLIMRTWHGYTLLQISRFDTTGCPCQAIDRHKSSRGQPVAH